MNREIESLRENLQITSDENLKVKSAVSELERENRRLGQHARRHTDRGGQRNSSNETSTTRAGGGHAKRPREGASGAA